MGRRTRSQRNQIRPAGPGVKAAEFARRLRREPDRAIRCWTDIVRPGARQHRAPAAAARPDGLSLPAASQSGDDLGQGLFRPARRGRVVSDTPQLLLAHHLKALKLPTFLREYDKL